MTDEQMPKLAKDVSGLREQMMDMQRMLQTIQFKLDQALEEQGSDSSWESEDDDEFYDQAEAFVREVGRASTSLLQRKFGIGYGRAAKLIDMLEENGIVGPAVGSKPRDVLSEEE